MAKTSTKTPATTRTMTAAAANDRIAPSSRALRRLLATGVSLLLTACSWGGGEGCFRAGTPVAVPAGSAPIESVKAGDSVYAYDSGQKQVVVGTVDALITESATEIGALLLDDGTKIFVTRDHPVYRVDTAQWVTVGALVPGAVLLQHGSGASTQPVRVQSLSFAPTSEPVYKLKVRYYDNAFIAGVLAHSY